MSFSGYTPSSITGGIPPYFYGWVVALKEIPLPAEGLLCLMEQPIFAFRSKGQLVLPPSVKRESLLSRDVILLDFSFFF